MFHFNRYQWIDTALAHIALLLFPLIICLIREFAHKYSYTISLKWLLKLMASKLSKWSNQTSHKHYNVQRESNFIWFYHIIQHRVYCLLLAFNVYIKQHYSMDSDALLWRRESIFPLYYYLIAANERNAPHFLGKMTHNTIQQLQGMKKNEMENCC